MLSFILLLWFALCALEPFLTMRQTQRCHLLLFADTFCGSVFPSFVLAFLFAHYVVTFQYDCRFRRSCCVEWFSHWPVLRLFPLPCHVVCHTVVWARAARNQTGYASNLALSVFSFANTFCRSSFCSDWFWTPISALRKHRKKTSQKHKTNFSNISMTLTKLLKHVKDTKQTSQTSQRHRTNISNTSNCVTKGSHTCTS